MLDGLALYDTEHRKHRFFRRYLSTIDFPCNVDFTHVPVASPLASEYIALLESKNAYVMTSPGCKAIITVSLFLRFSSSAMCFFWVY